MATGTDVAMESTGVTLAKTLIDRAILPGRLL